MNRTLIVAGLVLVAVAVSAPWAVAFREPLRARVQSEQPLIGLDGRWITQFQVYFIGDGVTRETCVMVIRDTQSGHFEMTSVSAESCAPSWAAIR